ncbi:hypothetical protein HMPREF1240_0425 [Streptococcus pyogenes GA03455]|nr:hypothetical protein HMPREF1240_0425 [Streptococcus pyogenes GA03455]
MSEAQEQTKQLEAKQGIHSILLFRLLKEAEKQEATKLAFQTEHEVGKSRDVDGQKTKMVLSSPWGLWSTTLKQHLF